MHLHLQSSLKVQVTGKEQTSYLQLESVPPHCVQVTMALYPQAKSLFCAIRDCMSNLSLVLVRVAMTFLEVWRREALKTIGHNVLQLVFSFSFGT